jgi:hypothetical protein
LFSFCFGLSALSVARFDFVTDGQIGLIVSLVKSRAGHPASPRVSRSNFHVA